MATEKARKPAKPKPRKLSSAQLAARITRDSAELVKRAGAAKAKPTKPKAKAAPRK